MRQEEKELLLRNLCSRLPYGVIVKDRNGEHVLTPGNTEFTDLFSGKCNIKPYLRPLSSMTEKEEIEYQNIVQNDGNWVNLLSQNLMEFFNRYHFDYCGLIPMGLALEAPEGMYVFNF